ncbi:hypothetical protein SERLADRAFT_409723 [Serpula lacrymans var. lacrymans S7.9]|uniref:DUF6534 domain-containing protein n=1 Tax=Serpula lacrymans var. lacrymans (strain S7.9) TaxID=578457 RepID=F8P3I8_SERL9|nr:uncharacterized protein SERLADRAFT_409723 [Serpula lacrymans var. lacrymans S7.9]EGO22087.1 hypothetical protein SERLADRAFT_409723 [Serpula lacrymans var. lacrymans S7.9]
MSDIYSELSAIPQLLPSLNDSFGAFYIGLLLAAILYGFTNLQLALYLQTQWKQDPVVYRIMTNLKVVLLWLLDTIHVACISHMLYYHLITNFANPLALLVIVWSFKAQIVITPLFTGQALRDTSLYAHRLWILGKGWNRILCLIQDWAYWEPIAVLSVLASNDFLLATSMCYLLALSRTGFSNLCSLAVIITCAVMPNNFIYMAIDFSLSKLYVNSFIALLNSRSHAERFGDATISALGDVRHPVKYQDDEEH